MAERVVQGGPGSTYESLRAGFAWRIPERLNLARACADDQVADHRALVSVDDEGRVTELTFGQLTSLSARLAGGLRALGVEPRDRVGVVIPQSPETGLVHLAIWRLGAISLPLASLFGPDALRFRLRDAGAKVVVTTRANAVKVRDAAPEIRRVIVEDDFPDLLSSSAECVLETGPDDPAFLIYTSGTTGQPKGALEPHRSVYGHLPGFELLYEFAPQPGDLIWTPADWAWIGALMDVVVPAWFHGIPVVTSSARFEPQRAIDLMAEQQVTLAFLPPTALKMMRAADVSRSDLRLRAIFSGGEPLGAEMLAWAEDRLGARINEGYGQTEANLVIGNCGSVWPIRPGSMGRAFPGHDVRTGINVLLLKLDNWARTPGNTAADIDAAVLERNVTELVTGFRAMAKRQAAFSLVVCCPAAPDIEGNPHHSRVLESAQSRLASELADAPGVRIIRSADVAATYPVDRYYDSVTETTGKVPYTEEYFAALGTVVARTIYQLRTAPYKVIAVDCDNTLWRGVVGEVGPDGVIIDEPIAAFHEHLVHLCHAGVLLCLCSKNNEADVVEVFNRRVDMPLRLDDFAARRVNWDAKSQNLRSLASELNVGLDSFIFIDDSPFEVAEVRGQCPEVLALQLPPDARDVQRFLTNCWAFDRGAVTSADLIRADSYRQSQLRDAARQQAGTLEDFLRDLQLIVTISAPGPADVARVAQMTQRTNQFNATTIRRTEPEVMALLDEGRVEARIVRVQDRFGDYGVVGVMLFEMRPDCLVVDTLLLSCRALARRVEHRMLSELGAITKSRGRETVRIPYIATARNAPVLAFLNSLGTTPAAVTSDHTFTLSAGDAIDAPALPLTNAGSDAAPDDREDSAAIVQGIKANSEAMARTYLDLATPSQLLEAMAARTHEPVPHDGRAVVAPRTPLEQRIADIWKRALHLTNVGVRDNFFDLGGTSLAAVPIFARLGRELGTEMTPYMLFEAPTIEELATLVEQRAVRTFGVDTSVTSLVKIRGHGPRRPLFLVHAGAGSILFYSPLAAALGPDQPVYGLQAQGLDGRGSPHATVEEMAAHYVAEIRTVQPAGPYQIAGFCFGATLAFEMAQQLRRANEYVSFLGSFDGPAPKYWDPGGRARPPGPAISKRTTLPRWARGLHPEAWRGVLYHVDVMRSLPVGARAAYPINKAAGYVHRTGQNWRNRAIQAYTARTGGSVPSVFRPFRWFFHLNHALAKRRYSPAPYPGDITVLTIKGRYQDPELGWRRWVTGDVKTVVIPGEFRGHRVLLYQPMVNEVAAQLRDHLAGG